MVSFISGSILSHQKNKWNVSAQGALNTTWDILGQIDYASATGAQKLTNSKKVRIVEYPWWNTSFNCRRLINVTQNTANNGSGIVEVRGFEPVGQNIRSTEDTCRILNCSNEIRITEALPDKTQQYVPFLRVDNEQYITLVGRYQYCENSTVKFNSTLNTNETKHYFVYFNSPIAQKDYSDINSSQLTISNNSYPSVSVKNFENVWDWFYNAHIDIWWTNSSDQSCPASCAKGSLTFQGDARNASSNLSKLNYSAQIYANRNSSSFFSRLPYDDVYVFYGHGGVDNSTINQTYIEITTYGLPTSITSNDISSLNQTISTKLVMSISSLGGDNSTTLINCPLNNWISKAFTEKGAGCYLGFLGINITSTCGVGCNCTSDVYFDDTRDFNNCFWGNISTGATIKEAGDNATLCALDNPQYILINKSVDSCKIKLLR